MSENENTVNATAIGYNIKQAKDLASKIVDIHRSLKNTITSQWAIVQNVMETQWVGPDEEKYEKIIAKRISTLYENSANIVTECASNILELARGWYKFQKTNISSNNYSSNATGDMTGDVLSVIPPLDTSDIKVTEDIITGNTNTNYNEKDRGLKSSNSAENIKMQMDMYVKMIQGKIDTLFNLINANSSFFGNQTSAVNKYVKSYEDAFKELNSAIRDLYNKLDDIQANYNTKDAAIDTSAASSASTVESTYDQKLDSELTTSDGVRARWSMN